MATVPAPNPAPPAANQAPRVVSSQPSTKPTQGSHTVVGAAPPNPAAVPPQQQPAGPATGDAEAAAVARSSNAPAAASAIRPLNAGSVPGTPGTPGMQTPPAAARVRKLQQALSITMEQVDAPGLLDYGVNLLSCSGVSVPTAEEQKRRGRSFDSYNACLSPVHVVAGWGVTALSADDKTRKFVEAMIEKKALDLNVTGKNSCGEALHPTISLIVSELGSPYFIRLYIEPQFAIPQITTVVEEINNAYGDSEFPVLKPLCFSCDDTGDATARKINHDVLMVTGSRKAAVIDPTNTNLNHLAQACLVTVFAVSFIWSPRDPTALPALAHFYGSCEKNKKCLSKVRCLTDSGVYRSHSTDQYDCIELTSHTPGEICYLIRPKNQSIGDWLGSASGSLIDSIVAELPKAGKAITVSVPLFTVETPMRLGEAAAAARSRYSLWRLFDIEKCKLNRMLYKNSDDSLCTLPLWDHYHQTVFEMTTRGALISDCTPKTDIEMLDANDSRKGASLDKPVAGRQPAGNDGARKPPKFVYQKLEDCTQGVWAELPKPRDPPKDGNISDMPGKLSFDTPFIFLVRRQNGKKTLPVAIGLFTNADTDELKDAPVD